VTKAAEVDRPEQVISVDIATAAIMCGTSRDQIERAIRTKALRAAFPTSRPVIKPSWLDDWVENLPDERP
jgi:hypothetical protein